MSKMNTTSMGDYCKDWSGSQTWLHLPSTICEMHQSLLVGNFANEPNIGYDIYANGNLMSEAIILRYVSIKWVLDSIVLPIGRYLLIQKSEKVRKKVRLGKLCIILCLLHHVYSLSQIVCEASMYTTDYWFIIIHSTSQYLSDVYFVLTFQQWIEGIVKAKLIYLLSIQ